MRVFCFASHLARTSPHCRVQSECGCWDMRFGDSEPRGAKNLGTRLVGLRGSVLRMNPSQCWSHGQTLTAPNLKIESGSAKLGPGLGQLRLLHGTEQALAPGKMLLMANANSWSNTASWRAALRLPSALLGLRKVWQRVGGGGEGVSVGGNSPKGP